MAGRELTCPVCGAAVGVRLEVPATFALKLSPDGEEILVGRAIAAEGPSDGQSLSEALINDAAGHLNTDASGPALVCEGAGAHAFEVDQLGRILHEGVR